MKKMFSIIINYNKKINIKNFYNTNIDYSCSYFLKKISDMGETTKNY